MGERSTSVTEPMKSLILLAVEASKEQGIVNADISVGFAWGDLAISGMGVAVSANSADDLSKALEIRNRLAKVVWERRYDFQICGEYAPDIDTAIKMALDAPESSVFMTDSGDNVTAGAPGDTTEFLKKLLEHQVPDAVIAGITDRENTEYCFSQGIGATVSIKVGGKLDTTNSKPLPVVGKVVNLYSPPAEAIDEWRTATIDLGNVLLVLTEGSWGFIKLKQFKDQV